MAAGLAAESTLFINEGPLRRDQKTVASHGFNSSSPRRLAMHRTITLHGVLLIGVLILVILGQASGAAAGTNVWTSAGPEGGIIHRPRHAHNPLCRDGGRRRLQEPE
jgi:hypothetical protein